MSVVSKVMKIALRELLVIVFQVQPWSNSRTRLFSICSTQMREFVWISIIVQVTIVRSGSKAEDVCIPFDRS